MLLGFPRLDKGRIIEGSMERDTVIVIVSRIEESSKMESEVWTTFRIVFVLGVLTSTLW